MKILLVEDRIDFANILEEEFKSYNFDIVTTQTSTSALKYLEKNKADILICDYHLDGYNAKNLVSLARKKYLMPSILMSADCTVADNTCSDAFVLKPFYFDELLNSVKSVTKKHEASLPQKQS